MKGYDFFGGVERQLGYLGMTYLVGKIKFELLFHGPFAE